MLPVIDGLITNVVLAQIFNVVLALMSVLDTIFVHTLTLEGLVRRGLAPTQQFASNSQAESASEVDLVAPRSKEQRTKNRERVCVCGARRPHRRCDGDVAVAKPQTGASVNGETWVSLEDSCAQPAGLALAHPFFSVYRNQHLTIQLDHSAAPNNPNTHQAHQHGLAL